MPQALLLPARPLRFEPGTVRVCGGQDHHLARQRSAPQPLGHRERPVAQEHNRRPFRQSRNDGIESGASGKSLGRKHENRDAGSRPTRWLSWKPDLRRAGVFRPATRDTAQHTAATSSGSARPHQKRSRYATSREVHRPEGAQRSGPKHVHRRQHSSPNVRRSSRRSLDGE
eukprot:scaffold3201_cov116-Isochrysis_galbana.AAC.4